MDENWYDPRGAGEGIRRCFSFINLGIFILTLVLLVSEFRFNWCETLAGRYLMATNAGRPEKGAVWESGRQILSARKFLDGIQIQKQNTHRNMMEAQTFADLAESLGAGEWVNLDKARFRQLYFSLSDRAQRKLIDPARLVWLLNGSTTDRIFCEGRVKGLKIYFIDSSNRVNHRIDLDATALDALAKGGESSGTLERLGDFSGKIYPAALFFEAVFQLPKDVVPDLIRNANTLLASKGTLERVGIWQTSDQGYITLGFEFAHLGEARVVRVRAREWAVWQLNLILKGEAQ